jgi:hypothetical protein
MRKMLLVGTVGMFAALCAINAAEAANPNVPSYSPYAVMGYDDAATSAPWMYGNPGPQPGMTEHRASFVEGGNNDNSTGLPNGNVPSYSPYAIMPQAR